MPKGYLVGLVKITNQDDFTANYSTKVESVFAPFGGKFIVRTDSTSHHEGRHCDRYVIVEFPSLEQATQAVESPASQAIKPHRVNNSDIDYGSFMLLPGV